jgi:NAD(P)-dependent dehydrogenase (short-subunit alcohol dehydrogenase family)
MARYDLEGLFGLSGKTAVITGGGGVLCGEMARALAQLGMGVAVLDLVEENAQKVVRQIVSQGGDAIAVKANVLERPSLEAARGIVLDRFGKVDVLINGAGGNSKKASTSDELSFFDLPEDGFRWVFDLNFLGTVLPSQVFGRHFAERRAGCIVNIASINAFRPLTRIPAYSAAKGAIRNFTQWLATHMAMNYSPDIRVNAIAPGFFLTEQNRFLLTDAGTGQFTPRGQSIVGHTPMGRLGQPDDLISTIVWLLAPGSRFVTGITVLVDGGFAAYSGV